MPAEISVTFQNTGPETWKTESTVSLAQVPTIRKFRETKFRPCPWHRLPEAKRTLQLEGELPAQSRLPVRRPLAHTDWKFVCDNKGVLSETSRHYPANCRTVGARGFLVTRL